MIKLGETLEWLEACEARGECNSEGEFFDFDSWHSEFDEPIKRKKKKKK